MLDIVGGAEIALDYSMVRSEYAWKQPFELPLRHFVLSFIKTKITNNDPLYQREDGVANPNGGDRPSKYQHIVHTILDKLDIGQIRLVTVNDGKYKFETLDGAHRVRALEKFLAGEFCIHKNFHIPELRGKYYSDLNERQKLLFDGYPMNFMIYDGFTQKQKGEQFRIANAGDAVGPMEKLNTYHPNDIANVVRRTARVIESEINKSHPMPGYSPAQTASIFELKISINPKTGTNVQNPKRLKFQNKHLCYDEIMARIMCMVWKGEDVKRGAKKPYCGIITSCDHGDDGALTKMYQAAEKGELDAKDVARIAKKAEKCIDFLAKVADGRRIVKKKSGLLSYEVTLLTRWYMHFTCYYGPFKFTNDSSHIKFYEEFDRAVLTFMGPIKEDLYDDDYNGRPISDRKGAFIGLLSEWSDPIDMTMPVLWLINEGKFNPVEQGIITAVDRKRCFTGKEIEQKYMLNKGRCQITGDPLKLEDARGAHIEAWSDGGKTDLSNFMVVHKKHNAAMCTMNALEYRDEYRRKNNLGPIDEDLL